MPKLNFTDRALKAIKPAPPGKRVPYWDVATPGLCLRVSDKSTKHRIGVFALMLRDAGEPKPTTFTLGSYPAACSIAEAREKARALRAQVKSGVNQKKAAAAAKAAEAATAAAAERLSENTFGAAWAIYSETKLADLISAPEIRRRVAKYALPKWRDRPLMELTHDDWFSILPDALEKMPRSGANLLHSALRGFFKWRFNSGHRNEPNPLERVAQPIENKTVRKHVLKEPEICAVWEAAVALGYPRGDLVRFLLWSGQRLRECAQATWDEFDLDAAVWTIKAPRMKGRKAHKVEQEVQLAPAVVAFLRGLPRGRGPFLFSVSDGVRPVGGFAEAKRKIDAASGVTGWRFHDLRRVFRSGLSELTVAPHVAELCIAHKRRGMVAIYDQFEFRPEKRDAFTRWAAKLAAITGDNSPASNVLPIHPEPRVAAS